MTSTHYQFNWKNFQSWAGESASNLYEDQSFADVTLVSDDLQELKAHRVILSASSPFFETILKKFLVPDPLLFLKGINFETLSLILRFVYKGEVNVPHEDVNNFMTTANEFRIRGLSVNADLETNMQVESIVDGKTDPLAVNVNKIKTERDEFPDIEENEIESEKQGYETKGNSPPAFKLKLVESPLIHQNLLGDDNKDFKDGQFRCEEKTCEKTFKTLIALKNHKNRMHLGEKNVKCPQCPKMFFSKGEVESHKTYVHNSAKNFTCSMCDKTFVTMYEANIPMKGVHLKIQEHECRFCGKRFSQSSNMYSHMKRKHFEDWSKWKIGR